MIAKTKAATLIAPENLSFIPLGGAGEIGMNLTLYGYKGQWVIVDMGVKFADEQLPGVNLIMPDPSFLIDQRENIAGIILTHAHEDHLGSLPWLWDKIQCPVWASPFAISVLKRKCRDMGVAIPNPLRPLPENETFNLGPFTIQSIAMNHSIPQPQAIVINCDHGTVVHSGDWTFDPDPLLEHPCDLDRLRTIGDKGVLALVCDSTNAMLDKQAPSEANLLKSLVAIIGKIKQGRVVGTCFASNVSRIAMMAYAAQSCDRQAVLVGRSMWRFQESARENGYLNDLPPFLNDREGSRLAPEKVLYICTGSQGEERAALSRIAEGRHGTISLDAGDSVIFSSSVIPGNEKAIGRVRNLLLAAGISILTEDDDFVHISGHPGQPELKQMYDLLRPSIAVPTHGEICHLQAHAALARSWGVGDVCSALNGDIIRLAPGVPEHCGRVAHQTVAVVGQSLVPSDDPIFAMRRTMIQDGVVLITIIVGKKRQFLADPLVAAPGFICGHNVDMLCDIKDVITQSWDSLARKKNHSDDKLERLLRGKVVSLIRGKSGLTPMVEVKIVRVEN